MKIFAKALVLGAALSLGGCYAGFASKVPGFLFAEVRTTNNEGLSDAADVKTGKSICKSILGLFATGDCSIEAAKKQGGISKAQYVDQEVFNVLGVYATYTTVVKGQ